MHAPRIVEIPDSKRASNKKSKWKMDLDLALFFQTTFKTYFQ